MQYVLNSADTVRATRYDDLKSSALAQVGSTRFYRSVTVENDTSAIDNSYPNHIPYSYVAFNKSTGSVRSWRIPSDSVIPVEYPRVSNSFGRKMVIHATISYICIAVK